MDKVMEWVISIVGIILLLAIGYVAGTVSGDDKMMEVRRSLAECQASIAQENTSDR